VTGGDLGVADIAVIGGSWGGFDVVKQLLGALSADLDLAVVIALHRGAGGPDGALVSALQALCALPVIEVDDKADVAAGRVHVAPADYHLFIEDGHFELSIDAPVGFSRPSIDVVFDSAAEAYGSRVVGVLLTGANADGAEGMRRIKARGGMTLVQEPRTAERAEMPEAAIATGAVDRVLPVEAIAALINELGRRG
jgi:two-component system, chemotaxis family, protein-glutamate methylesterase/glutaminase